jgi:predicted phage terminase large subunit-like protein
MSSLPAEQRRALLDGFTAEELVALEHDWRVWGRPEQQAPEGDWRVWLLLAGRGFGKTRTGAEWVRAEVEAGRRGRLALVAPTAADARDVMVEGESGVLAVSPPGFRPLYEPSKRRLTWPNGAQATTYSADEPDRLRGPQHDGAWCDELAAWRYPEAWDMLQFGLRLGRDPRAVVTTTPKPVRLVRELVAAPTTVVTKGSTYANLGNLAPAFLDQIVRKYEGTRLGRQELDAEILDDVPGALWTRTLLDGLRVREHPDLVRVVVAIDPAVTSGEKADETGIVVAGKGVDGQGYVLADASCRLSPDGWARRAVEAYRRHQADRIVAEVNNGGEMVELTIRTVDPHISYAAVHASRGKRTRAEPVAALYEQGKVHHAGGFPDLEDQMCTYTPDAYDGSPDRVDALVWALTDLMLEGTSSVWFAG